MALELPSKGFTKSEREWLAKLLAELKSLRAIHGQNCTVDNNADGQVINADSCDCSLCP